MKNVQNSIASIGITLSLMGLIPWGGFINLKSSFLSQEEDPPDTKEALVLIQGNTLQSLPLPFTGIPATRKLKVIATAYSSTPEQTDETPFITASGKQVREGIVAANFLPLGTKIMVPDLYGERVFVIEDRMHPRKEQQIDIWFPDSETALHFGAKTVTIEVF